MKLPIPDRCIAGHALTGGLRKYAGRNDVIVLAVPVAPPATVRLLEPLMDEVICLFQPEPFWAIGRWYRDFSQVSDAEVEALLAEQAERLSEAAGGATQ